jgi:lactoylglutathione lyase
MNEDPPEESLSLTIGELLASVSDTIDHSAPELAAKKPPPLPASDPTVLDESLAVHVDELLESVSHTVEDIDPEDEAAPAPIVVKVAQLVLIHDDLVAASRFYGEWLGLEPRRGNDEMIAYWLDARRASVIVVTTAPEARMRHAPPGVHAVIELVVEDLDGSFERLRRAGVVVVEAPCEKPWGGRGALVRDPAGYLLGISAEG